MDESQESRAPEKAENSEPGPAEVRPEARITDQPQAKKAAPPARGRSGNWFLTTVLSGLVCAGAGAAGSIYVIRQSPELRNWLGVGQAAGLEQRLSDHESRIDALGKQLQTLSVRPGDTAALDEFRSAQEAATAQLSGRIDGLDGAVKALGEQVAQIETMPAAVAGAGVSADVMAQINKAAEDARAAEEAARQIKDEAGATTREAARILAISHLTAALESGAAFAPALAQLGAAGVAVPPELSAQAQGVPTQQALKAAFPDAARDALAQSLAETSGDGFWNKAGAFFRSQAGARSLTPRAGSDPDAVLSRAEAALNAGALQAVLDEIAQLPPSGQARMAEWAGLVEKRLAAKNAITALSLTE